MPTLVIISGGLREPSSTRLLADRIDAAVRAELAYLDISATSSVVELRPIGRAIMDAMLTGFPSAALQSAFDIVAGADGVIAVTPAFNASFSGLFKILFRRRARGSIVRHAGADRSDRRHRATFAGARTRAAADVLLPARDRLTHRGVRGHRRLRRAARIRA